MKWSIGQKLAAGFALPLVILSAIGASSHRTLNRLIESGVWVEHTYQVLGRLGELRTAISDAESRERGYLVSGRDEFVVLYQTSAARVPDILRELTTLTADNPNQQRRLEALRPVVDRRLEGLKRMVEVRRAKGLEAVATALSGDDALTVASDIQEKIGELEMEEQRLLKARSAESEAGTRATQAVIVWGTALGFLLVFGAAVLITRRVTDVIRTGIQQIASSAAEILAATTQQASGTQEEGVAIQQTTSTIQEVKQTALLSSQKAQVVAELVGRTSQASLEGRRAAQETLEGMREAKARMEGIAERVLGLSEQGQAIAEIIASVNDLTEQSNLLAVNAAIEAAKAGESGKGFSVVASEVKALAEQSKQATSQVRQILGEIQRTTQAAVLATEQGVKASDAGESLSQRTGESIHLLTESLAEAAQAAKQILITAQEQSAGVEQVASAMANISQVSTQNMAATRQMARAAQDLNSLAQQFKALVSGSRTQEPSAAAAAFEAGARG
jgi:methyl-accepting chemotaxis protein